MACDEVSDHGDVCAEEGEHWLHVTKADDDGLVTAWGLRPGEWDRVECPAKGCGVVAGIDPERPIVIVHNYDGSHLFVEADGTTHSVHIHLDHPRHLHVITTEEA